MDNQQAFDSMVAGLSARGWTQAQGEGASYCAYRSREGTQCAVGLLIPNDRYKEDIEGCHPGDALMECGVEHTCSRSFLVDAQWAHDLGYRPAEMRDRFRAVGLDYGLTWPEEVK